MKSMPKSIRFFLTVAALLLFGLACSSNGFAAETSDSGHEDAGADFKDFSKKRRTLIREHLHLSPETSKRFWPLYDQFQTQLESFRLKRREVLFDLGKGLDGMSDEEAKEYVNDRLELDQKRAEITRQYFNQLATFMSYRNLALYIQLETKIRVFVEAGIEESIPLIQ